MSASDDDSSEVDLFDSPEDAALSGWVSTPSAHAHVIEVQPTDRFDGVYVIVQTDAPAGFHDRDIVSCARASNGKWWDAGSTGA